MGKADAPEPPSGFDLRRARSALAAHCSKRRWELAGFGIYLVIAVALTWPVILSSLTQIPVGSEPAATVALSNIWISWWNADRLLAGFSNYWNAPIFFPSPGALAMNEPQPTTLLVAPFTWLTGSRILSYNVYVWMSLILNGVFAQRLAKVYGMGRWPALWTGAAMVLLPMVSWQIGIAHLIPLWGFLWTWAAIEGLCREPSRRRGVELGFAVGIAYITCLHQGLLFSFLLVGAAPVLWKQWTKVRELRYWLLAVLVALVITGPFILKISSVVEQHAVDWDREWIVELSATPVDYLRAYGGQLIGLVPENSGWMMLSAGSIKYLLAIFGIIYGLSKIDTRRWSAFLLAMAVLAFLFSLGPNLKLGGWQPWWWLSDRFDAIARIRSVLRFGFFFQAAVVVLAGLGLIAIYHWCHNRVNNPRGQVAVRWAVIALALTALFEIIPRRGVIVTPPDIGKHKVWVKYVREHTPEDHGILCLPVAAGGKARQYQLTAEWMYLGTFHGVPNVTGYATHFPEHYLSVRSQILAGFPTAELIRRLHEEKVKFVVVKRGSTSRESPPRNVLVDGYFLKRVVVDQLVEVYEVGYSGS